MLAQQGVPYLSNSVTYLLKGGAYLLANGPENCFQQWEK